MRIPTLANCLSAAFLIGILATPALCSERVARGAKGLFVVQIVSVRAERSASDDTVVIGGTTEHRDSAGRDFALASWSFHESALTGTTEIGFLSNQVSITQDGRDNLLSARIDGVDNLVSVGQRGDGGTIVVRQTGHHNRLFAQQSSH